MKKTILLLLVFFCTGAIFAQERDCSTMENLEYRKQLDPQLEARMQQIEDFTRQRIQQNGTQESIIGNIIMIPVVVHVIYNTAQENISQAQIQSQIDVLNEDFRRLNTNADNRWAQAVDTEIQFCLATIDENGNATTGITRKSSSTTAWGTNDAMKSVSQGGVDPWNTSEYLNMWICNIGGGILGYAQFPGGAASTDGVVMSPQYFGSSEKGSGFYLTAPFDLGRTTTHEVGHFLNLRHIWGDGNCTADDFVSDTPTSDAPNRGCDPTHVSCGSTDMVQNYMDYSDDACMNLYTAGQKARMRAVLEAGGARRSLALSEKCGAVAPMPTCNDGIQNGDETGVDCGGSSCAPCQTGCSDNEVTLTITFDNYPEETSWSIVTDGGTAVASQSYSTSNAIGSTITETFCLPNDCYTFAINDVYGDGMCCTYGSGSYTLTGPDGQIKSGGSFTSTETTDFCLGTTPPPTPTCTDGIQNGDETGIDCGGSSCEPCATQGTTVLHEGFFESGLDGWTDGGSDCYRYNGNFSYEGSYAMRLRDNSGTRSAMTSEAFDLQGFDQVEFTFYFYANSMENREDFFVRYFNGSSWSSVARYISGTNFNNGTFYTATVTLNSTDVNFASNSRFRIQCDASSNADQVYIDQVTINGINGATTRATVDGIQFRGSGPQGSISGDFLMTPTVTRGDITINLASYNVNSSYRVLNLLGQTVKTGTLKDGRLNVAELKAGVYLLEVSDEEETFIEKFVKE